MRGSVRECLCALWVACWSACTVPEKLDKAPPIFPLFQCLECSIAKRLRTFVKQLPPSPPRPAMLL